MEKASKIIDFCARAGITVLSWADPRFPVHLKLIPDPPLVLYVKGDARKLAAPFSIAIIGTREPTEWGRKFAHESASQAARHNVTVVSGLAKGCDVEAHLGTLDEGGTTIAVLAHGVDITYPAAHRPVAQSIVEGGGALVSEYPPGERAQAGYFVDRDRIQSGLSTWILVVETDVKGGTMHTVEFAKQQGRRIYALQHPIEYSVHEKSNGNRYLLSKSQALPIRSAEELGALLWGVVPKGRKPRCDEGAEAKPSVATDSDGTKVIASSKKEKRTGASRTRNRRQQPKTEPPGVKPLESYRDDVSESSHF